MEDNWHCEKQIGYGAFAEVTLWISKTGEELVIKQCRSRLSDRARIRWHDEIEMLCTKRHPNLVQGVAVPREIMQKINSPEALLGLEMCECDLRKVLGNISNCCGLKEKIVLRILDDVAHGLEFLHHNNIVHRDLKPENILKARGSHDPENVVYKITDLGYAKQLDNKTFCKTFVGTFQYMAPELYRNNEGYKNTADYWSFGTLIFECITGKRPFQIASEKDYYDFCNTINKKTDQEIYGHKPANSNGKVVFSSQIPSPNQMCIALRKPLQSWLQLVLRYDPDTRGMAMDDTVQCFQQIYHILQTRLVYIIDMMTCARVAFACKPGDTVITLKYFVERELTISIEQQLLIRSDSGELLPENLPLEELSVAEATVFVFREDAKARHTSEIPGTMSPEVLELVSDPKAVHKRSVLIERWSHCYYYCMNHANTYTRLLQGERLLKTHMLRQVKPLLNTLQQDLYENSLVLDTRVTLFCESVDYDREFCCSENKTALERDWDELCIQVQAIKQGEAVDAYIKVFHQFRNKLELLDQSFSVTHANEFEEITERVGRLLVKLREKDKNLDQSYDSDPINKQMLNCICKFEEIHKQFYKRLREVCVLRKDLLDFIEKMKSKISEIEKNLSDLKEKQRYRQAGSWNIKQRNPQTSSDTNDPIQCFQIQLLNSNKIKIEKDDLKAISNDIESLEQLMQNDIPNRFESFSSVLNTIEPKSCSQAPGEDRSYFLQKFYNHQTAETVQFHKTDASVGQHYLEPDMHNASRYSNNQKSHYITSNEGSEFHSSEEEHSQENEFGIDPHIFANLALKERLSSESEDIPFSSSLHPVSTNVTFSDDIINPNYADESENVAEIIETTFHKDLTESTDVIRKSVHPFVQFEPNCSSKMAARPQHAQKFESCLRQQATPPQHVVFDPRFVKK